MARIVEFFGYAPRDQSVLAKKARSDMACPFVGGKCSKTLNDGKISGVCTLERKNGPVICCPIRLYANKYAILKDIAQIAFGMNIPLIAGDRLPKNKQNCIAVFGRGWGKELRLPNRGKKGGYFVDWILVHINSTGDLVNFVAVEVQSIDTTGNYRSERSAYLKERDFFGKTSAGFNWENVNKRILPQIIYKGHVLRQEPLCQKGLFFVCPTPVYRKIDERLGGSLRPYPIQAGALTILWYDLGPIAKAGNKRQLINGGNFTTTVDQVANAFTAPSNLPPAQVYEKAIRAELSRGQK